MSKQTYGGHTLAEIKAAAEGMSGWNYNEARRVGEDEICEFGTELDGEWYPIGTVDAQTFTSEPADDVLVARYIVTANPTTVLAMAARIKYLESAWHVEIIERKDAIIAKQERHNDELKARIAELERAWDELHAKHMFNLGAMQSRVDTARLEAWQAARDKAAKMLRNAGATIPIPPAQGTIESAHNSGLCCALVAIEAMQPPAEWTDIGNTITEQKQQVADVTLINEDSKWPHDDGFGGGLTERRNDGQD